MPDPKPQFEETPEQVVDTGSESPRATGPLNERGTASLDAGESAQITGRGKTRALSSLAPEVSLASVDSTVEAGTPSDEVKEESPQGKNETLVKGTALLRADILAAFSRQQEKVSSGVEEAKSLTSKLREYEKLLEQGEELLVKFFDSPRVRAPRTEQDNDLVREYEYLKSVVEPLREKKETAEKQLADILSDGSVAEKFKKVRRADEVLEKGRQKFGKDIDEITEEIVNGAQYKVRLLGEIKQQETAVTGAWEALGKVVAKVYDEVLGELGPRAYGYRITSLYNASKRDPDVFRRELLKEKEEFRRNKAEETKAAGAGRKASPPLIGGALESLGKVRESLKQSGRWLSEAVAGEFREPIKVAALDFILEQEDLFEASRSERGKLSMLEDNLRTLLADEPVRLSAVLGEVVSKAGKVQGNINRVKGTPDADELVSWLLERLKTGVRDFMDAQPQPGPGERNSGELPRDSRLSSVARAARDIFEKVTGVTHPREGTTIKPKLEELDRA